MKFTKTEKALLDRAARRAIDDAGKLKDALGTVTWGANKDTKKAKAQYDRLMREARDLRALGKALLKLEIPAPILVMGSYSTTVTNMDNTVGPRIGDGNADAADSLQGRENAGQTNLENQAGG